eukprot:XP_019926916.1 PREDICTED: uncharacterized protein LOC109619977 isoform X2 [Crassostrea gigas]
MSETEENIDVANVSNNAIPNPLPGKSIGSCSLNKGSIQGLENHSQNKENRHIHVRVMNARHEVSQRNSIRAEKSITKSSEASISSRIVTKGSNRIPCKKRLFANAECENLPSK